jgi:hypothetical protein
MTSVFLPVDTVMFRLSRYYGIYMLYFRDPEYYIYIYTQHTHTHTHTQHTHTHTHTHIQENVLIHYCYKLLFPWYAGLKAGHL